jgi:hypothetical protein
MFRIECFVTDKHLPDVLRALGQRVMNLSVVPVVDAVVTPAGKRAENKPKVSAVDAMDTFIKELRKAPAPSAAAARAAAQASGYAEKSYSNLLRKAVELNLIVRKGQGQGTTYSWPKTGAK